MKLHEYRAKEIFSQFGIPVPKSIVIDNENEGEAIHKELEFPVALKAQVLVGGRGLSIASADLGWRRSDEPLPIFPRDRATCGGRPPAAGRPRCSSSRASSPAPPTPPG